MTNNNTQMKLMEVNPSTRNAGKKVPYSDVAFDLTDALAAPILTFSQQWASAIPERLLKLVPLARMINLYEGINQATYVEGTIYLYTRALEAPMDSDWVDIYTHISCKTLESWFQEDPWDSVKAPRTLSDWQQHKLNDLLKHIYTKRREMVKQRINERKKESSKTATSDTPVHPTSPIAEQQSFDF